MISNALSCRRSPKSAAVGVLTFGDLTRDVSLEGTCGCQRVWGREACAQLLRPRGHRRNGWSRCRDTGRNGVSSHKLQCVECRTDSSVGTHALDSRDGSVLLTHREVDDNCFIDGESFAWRQHQSVHPVCEVELTEVRSTHEGDESCAEASCRRNRELEGGVVEAAHQTLSIVCEQDKLDASEPILQEQVTGAGTVVDHCLKHRVESDLVRAVDRYVHVGLDVPARNDVVSHGELLTDTDKGGVVDDAVSVNVLRKNVALSSRCGRSSTLEVLTEEQGCSDLGVGTLRTRSSVETEDQNERPRLTKSNERWNRIAVGRSI